MSTQAASTRPMNRPMQDVQNRAAMQETPTQPMPRVHDARISPGTETKQSFLTTEFWVFIVAAAAVVIAALWSGPASGLNVNNPNLAWWYLTVLTGAYLISRGLAKAGTTRRSMAERRSR